MPGENTYALTTLDRVKEYLGTIGTEHHSLIITLINGWSSRAEKKCRRNFRSRTYQHDGTVRPRLDSHGGNLLFLRNAPVTSVTTLKVYPSDSALTQGYNGDYILYHDAGIIELTAGTFYNAPAVVECTYVGGFLDTLTANQPETWGWNSGGEEIEMGIVQQVAWSFNKRARERDGIASRSAEGTTVTYLVEPWLPEVEEMLKRHTRFLID